MIEIYMNAPGETPMRRCRTIDIAGLGESEVVQVLEMCVGAWHELGRRVKSQVVIVRDGVIVAVEAFGTGKLVWVDQTA